MTGTLAAGGDLGEVRVEIETQEYALLRIDMA